jgi:hypothetical protein
MPNTGEVTEDYSTYMRHLLTAGFFGFIAGVIMTCLAVYTTVYQSVGASMGNFAISNPIITFAGVGIISLVSYVFIRSKFPKKVKK